MEILNMIRRYGIRLPTEKELDSGEAKPGNIYLCYPARAKKDKALAMISANKAEIIAELERQKAEEEAGRKAAEELERKANAIEGLRELRAAQEAWSNYRAAFNRMMDDEYNDGIRPPKKPTASPSELAKAYPRAAAYLKAKNYSLAANCAKAAAGERAARRIANGEDFAAALTDMENEWSAYCEKHVWD